MFLDTRNITHGTPQPKVDNAAWRVGVAFSSKQHLLTRAQHQLLEAAVPQPTWFKAPQVWYVWQRFLAESGATAAL